MTLEKLNFPATTRIIDLVYAPHDHAGKARPPPLGVPTGSHVVWLLDYGPPEYRLFVLHGYAVPVSRRCAYLAVSTLMTGSKKSN